VVNENDVNGKEQLLRFIKRLKKAKMIGKSSE